MRVLITGAAGYLGRSVVSSAIDAGHEVVALVRRSTVMESLDWAHHEVTVVRGDLRQQGPWNEHLAGIDAVVHLAAATSGRFDEQFSNTVVATENLMRCVAALPIRRFVHVSSLAVYDYASLPPGATLDEWTPLEQEPERRDSYTVTKLIQERMIRSTCSERGIDLVVVRPGAIYGPGADWQHGAAVVAGRVALIFSPRASLRLTHVTNCAEAVVRALDSPAASGRTVNIVDDDLPSHMEFFRQCARVPGRSAIGVPIPWYLVDAVGRVVELANVRGFGRRARLPEVLDRRRQGARWKPLRYSNLEAKRVLGWTPRLTIETGIDQMRSDGTS